MGESLSTIFDGSVDVHSAADRERVPGLDWKLSDDTKKAIEEINANIRAAEQMSGRLIAG